MKLARFISANILTAYKDLYVTGCIQMELMTCCFATKAGIGIFNFCTRLLEDNRINCCWSHSQLIFHHY